jgi:hypothetical protein
MFVDKGGNLDDVDITDTSVYNITIGGKIQFLDVK